MFACEAEEAVHFYSRGIPRVMNLLCEHALINAYVEHLNPVPASMVEEAARDFLMDEFRPLAARTSGNNHLESKLSMIRQVFRSELARPLTNQAGRSYEEAVADLVPVASAGAVRESAFFRIGRIAATALEDEASVPPDTKSDTIHAVRELVPAVFGRQPRQGAGGDSPAASTRQTDAAELMASMWRMLESASASTSHRVDLRKIDKESSPIALSAAILRKISQSFHQVKKLVWQWTRDFKRDWNAMIGAIPIPQVKKALLYWLREPLTSKRMASSKD